MALILNIETATDVCSVALAKNGTLVSIAESDQPKSHAGTVTQFIKQVLDESGYPLSQLDAVAVSKGPGSYTGLRIGTATSKGLCYALEIPLIAINTLQAMSSFFLETNQPSNDTILTPLLDARRMEIYTASYDCSLNEIAATSAKIISADSFSDILNKNKIAFFGDGAFKCKNMLHPNKNAFFDLTFKPSAKGMFTLSEKYFAEKKFEDLAYFEPFYLKDFVSTFPKKQF